MQINETTITGLAAGGLPDDCITQADIADNAVGLDQLAGIARGKIIYGDASGNPAVLAPGSADQVLTSDGTDISWAAASGGMPTTGGTFTGDVFFDGATAGRDIHFDRSENELVFEDNAKLVIGSHASNRCTMYDDGTDIYLDSQHNKLKCRIADENGWTLNNEGSFDAYYDNNIKFATTTSGATIWGSLNETSDSSQKEDVTTISGATAKIKAINPVTFTWKKGTTAHPDREPTVKSAGVIAQELESVLPDFVGESTNPVTGEKLKTVDYTALTGYLIATVKELEARIATLEAA
tara:strand:+ start:28 stop:912 length:885 start_codon:yes stop_codon:yes gene_type:complete